jgi:hypothetical protein
MKLLEAFRRQLDELGDVRRVWLTTFSLRIEFVEKYLLPAVLGMDVPRNRLDYEGIQQELVKRNIDVQLFVDQRMLTQASDRKRTSIPVTGVAPVRLDDFSEASLFHPKVIYLEAKDGRGVLGAGSANLTVDGWGKNQEVFAFCKVCTDEQARQVRSFFRPLFETFRDNAPMPPIVRQRWGEDGEWKFVHSLAHVFADELRAGQQGIDEMTIVSPYFPRDLAGFLQVLRQRLKSPELVFHIVPDLLAETKLRTLWTPALQEEIEAGRATFHHPGVPSHDGVLRHAKVWATRSAVAIGSWNCTHPGSNAGRTSERWDDDNNVEAGILFLGPVRQRELRGHDLDVSAASFQTAPELDEDALDIPPASPVAVRVVFDWKAQAYRVSALWTGKQERGYRLLLPDHGELTLEHAKPRWVPDPIFVPEPNEIVSNHFFYVVHGDETVLQGVIEEVELGHRRGECYESLDDLLDSHLPEYEGRAAGARSPRGRDNEESGEDGGDEEPAVAVATPPAPTYFKVFYALHAYGARLRACKDVDELERCVFALAGGLKELQEKVRALSGEAPGAVYKWFLVHELNQLIRIAKAQRRTLSNTREDEKWQTLKPEAAPRIRSRANAACVDWVEEELRREFGKEERHA